MELKSSGNWLYTTEPILSPEKVIETIGNVKIVFTNKTPLPKSGLSTTPSVKYIGVLATGYNVVDAAKENGIVVTNIPS